MKRTRCFWRLAGLAGVLFLTGCGRPDIQVVDQHGAPVQGAKVLGISLSISGQTTYTNSRGHADIPWAIQETHWITVSKAGHATVGPVTVQHAAKPITIVLPHVP